MDIIRYQPITGVPAPHTTAWVDDVLDTVPGSIGALISRGLTMTREGMCGAALSLWPDAKTARSATLPSVVGTVGLGEPRQYVVVHAQQGSVPSAATYLQITTFDGPRAAAWSAAFERADRERIGPAVLGTPGVVATVLCRAADGGALALTLAVSVESLEAALAAIMSTELLPGEDPAMLTGPDRVDVQRLLHADLPYPARSTYPARSNAS